MKVGIVTPKNGEIVGRAIEQVASMMTSYQFERFTQDSFQPKYVAEKSLDAVIFEGNSAQDESFALAVRRHSSVPIFYLAQSKVHAPLDGIEVYHIVDQDQQKGFIPMLARLTEVLK